MRAALALRRDDLWTRRVRRMVGLSTAIHVGLFASTALLGAWIASRRPAPMVAYSVELTDMPGTGGRLPGGPGKDLIGRNPAPPAAAKSAAAPAPTEAAPKPVEAPPAKPVEAPPVPPKAEVTPPVAPPKVEAKKIEPKPAEPKAEVKKAEVKKPEPKPVAEVEAKKIEPKPAAKVAEAPKETAKPAAETQAAPQAAAKAATDPKAVAPPQAQAGAATTADDYAAAAERFRNRVAAATGTGDGAPGAGVAGGGPGGGVLGTGGDGRGGGQLRSLEYVAYLQRVRNAVQERWASAISQPGLVATVRFNIARDGTVSDVRLEQSSGNAVYDQTALAAVQRVGRLPPPPAAYVEDFRDFQVNFRGSEIGGVSG